MGGNYFKLGRMPRDQYLILEQKLRKLLDQHLGSDSYCIPRYYGDKPDFGDVDILLSTTVTSQKDWKQLIKELLQLERFESNGKLLSAVYESFQVDFFPSKFLKTQRAYMDFNDLGNFIGKLFRPFQLKYGEKGLFYVYRWENSQHKHEFLVSRDWQLMFRFVKLDYAKWLEGFATLEEMFEWILESPYFRCSPYLDPQSSTFKKKTKQRTTTRKFIEYLEKNQVSRDFDFDTSSREAYVTQIDAHFGTTIADRIKVEQEKEAEARLVDSKFNGKLVMEWVPGLCGKELGAFLRTFRLQYPRQTLLEMDPMEIRQHVLQLAQTEQNQKGG